MIRATASVEIDRPIEEVFEYTNDHVAEWSITVVEDEPIQTTPDRVGSTFRCVTQDRGQRMEFTGEIIKWEPPFLSICQLTGTSFDIEVAYQFEDMERSTRVTQVSIVKPKGFFLKIFMSLIARLASKGSCDAAAKEMNSLKRHCESREAPAG